MPTRRPAILSALVLILTLRLFCFPGFSWASSYSAVVVYGDSLSDNGNLYKATGGLAPASPPYFNGRFSNGPVSIEQLAAQLNAPLLDFAFGGATTGVGNIGDGGTQTRVGGFGLPGMLTELHHFTAPSALIPSSLFVVWGGADDFESAGSPTVAAGNIDAIVQSLEAEGATHILVPGLPNLGLTPEFYGDPAAIAYSDAFNQMLQANLPAGATYFNTSGLLDDIVAHPARYGLTYTRTPCYNQLTGTVCPAQTQSQYLFFDDIHPTTTADSILASQFAAAVIPVAATPEPSSFLLLGSGIAAAAGFLRRRKLA